ncbi:MAG: 16S rRNA (uracil(1498)-N(3))-methyltransferase, partial [Clostridia bacterium]|nr:16S rRNA (uracil(1498)-N(3))-methyltransferase [Clostridia bacterium]
MPRFFVSPEAFAENGLLRITGEDAKHISFALRMAAGDLLTVCDGAGKEYSCRLTKLDGETVFAEVLSQSEGKTECPVRVRLFQAYPKSDKLETVIQKAVELGVYDVTPFESERCVKRPKADKIERTLERQNKIAEEAAKQCGRSVLPRVLAPLSFDDMLKEAAKSPLALFCYEGGGTPIGKLLACRRGCQEIAVIV